MVLFSEAFVLHAKTPMGIALGESAVGGDLVHLLVIAHLEDDGEEVQAVGASLLTDLLFGSQQVGGEGGEGVRRHNSGLRSILGRRRREGYRFNFGKCATNAGIIELDSLYREKTIGKAPPQQPSKGQPPG